MNFGRYDIISEIGEGGMAKIYLAQDPLLNRQVALKVLQPHFSTDSSLLNRFTDEAKTSAALKSPHIIEIYDYGFQDNRQFFVMEHIKGYTLSAICSQFKKKRLPSHVCAALICQAAEGLAVADQHQVVHRDIKPDNLIISKCGVLKIADFGIAKLSTITGHTQIGTLLGSPHFMAPEQFNEEALTPKADLWALGIVFYYCLSGQLPFSGKNMTQIMRKVCNDTPMALESLRSDIDPELKNYVNGLLQKAPDKRSPNSRQLADALRNYLGKHGIFNLEEMLKDFLNGIGPIPNAAIVKKHSTPGSEITSTGSPKLTPSQLLAISNTGIQFPTPTGAEATHITGSTTITLPPYKNPFIWVAIILLAAITIRLYMPSGPGATSSGVDSIFIVPDSITLRAGESFRVQTRVKPFSSSQTLLWEIDDPTIATVSKGAVFGLKSGFTIASAISIADPTKFSRCYINVSTPHVSKVKLRPESVDLYLGDSATLTAIVEPYESNQKIFWSLDTLDVIILKNGVINTLQPGQVIVTVFSEEDSEKSAQCLVTVKAP